MQPLEQAALVSEMPLFYLNLHAQEGSCRCTLNWEDADLAKPRNGN